MTTDAAGCLEPAARRFGRLRLLRRFGRDRKGTAAIEFGMVAAPFLALMFAILETALVFFASQTLETAVADSARLIMTGQAQTAATPFTQDNFKSAVCSRIYALFDCPGGLKIDVRSYSSASGWPAVTTPVNAQGELINDFQYSPGTAGDVVVVRAMYEWPVMLPFFGLNLSNLANGKRLIMSTSSFRNEPFL
jgi:Flp pilus assembly protein TadG